jgi:protoheme IX farnesyltransferase
LIGWAAAGGRVTDHRIALLAGVFFLWQIPHFWLLAIRRSEDYRRAGLPTVAQTFTAAQTARITLVWVVALAAGTFLLAAVGPLRQPLPRALCALAAASVLWPAVGRCLGRGPDPLEPCLSARPERFMALLVFALLLEGLLTDYRPFLISLAGISIG